MKIIFCLSYLSVPHTITIIKENANSDFKIVTSNQNLYLFFCELFNNENVIIIPSFSYTIPFSKGIILLPIRMFHIVRMKKKTWKLFENYDKQEVFFFFNTSAFSQAWLIYKLSKKNKIFYQEDINLSHFPIRKSINTFINALFIKIIFNAEVYALNQGDKTTAYKLKSTFFKKLKIRKLNIVLNYREVSSWVNNRLNLSSGDILMLTNLMPEHELEIEVHIKASDKLINSLKKEGYSVHFKMHSRAKTKYSLEKSLFEVPKYLPASALLNYKVFIGYVSSALCEAANNDILSISLIDYIPSKKEAKKKNMKVYLQSNLLPGKKIFFPKTIEEIKNTIKTHM